MKNGIHETTEFLELFLRNLLLNENHPLHNRSLHISGLFSTSEKANIEDEKANIERKKVNIEDVFTVKTASHICKLLDKFGFQTIFSRSDVQTILDLKPTRSTELLLPPTQTSSGPKPGSPEAAHELKARVSRIETELIYALL